MTTTEDDDDYQNGKVYSIVCNITKEQYVGSTILTLEERLRKHKINYNKWLQDNNNSYTSSFQILERGDYEIILLENCPCNNNEELRMKEREWFDKVPNVNIIRPFITEEEKKEQIKENNKEYYEQHKEEQKEYCKEWRNQHKEQIKEFNKKYKEQIKERNTQPFICECGSIPQYRNKTYHFKTQKHLDYLNTKKATDFTEI